VWFDQRKAKARPGPGGEIIEKQLRGTVMRLKSNANAAYVDWELAQLFSKKDVRIQ
jgi:hypothetical protein